MVTWNPGILWNPPQSLANHPKSSLNPGLVEEFLQFLQAIQAELPKGHRYLLFKCLLYQNIFIFIPIIHEHYFHSIPNFQPHED